jgi:hypothetical protein
VLDLPARGFLRGFLSLIPRHEPAATSPVPRTAKAKLEGSGAVRLTTELTVTLPEVKKIETPRISK